MAPPRIGETIDVLVSRNEIVRTVSITLGETNTRRFSIAEISNPSEKQKRVYEKWLGKRF